MSALMRCPASFLGVASIAGLDLALEGAPWYQDS